MKQTFKLYGGKYELVFDNEASKHRYIINGEPKRGVTEVLGKILHKPGLMKWPLVEGLKYLFGYEWDTITLKATYSSSKAFLKPDTKYTELELTGALDNAYLAHMNKSDKGRDTGTYVHEAIENYLKTGDTTTMVAAKEAQKAFDAFRDWYSKQNINPLKIEQPVFSPDLDYCGTFDALLEIDGKVVLVDFKTTNVSQYALRKGKDWTGIYPENFLQLGAYSKAYHEERKFSMKPETRPNAIEDLMVVNITKDGKVHTISASELGLSVADCEDAWEMALKLNDWLIKLKRNQPKEAV